jgi:hypothetical protein
MSLLKMLDKFAPFNYCASFSAEYIFTVTHLNALPVTTTNNSK